MSIPILSEQVQTDQEIVSIGLDLSMTDTGIAGVMSDGAILTDHITSKGRKDATVSERRERLKLIVDGIQSHPLVRAGAGRCEITIEGPSYGSTGGAAHERAGLWWLTVDVLLAALFRVHVVAPSTLKKYATGKGNASKDEVIAGVVRRYPQADVTNNNVADAVVLAAIGARHACHPVDELTVQRADAFAKVRWAA